MTKEQFEIVDELENVLLDMQGSLSLWDAAQILLNDEHDRERANALEGIFGERIRGEIEQLEKLFHTLHTFFVEGGRLGF